MGCRPAAVAPIRPLAWELPYAVGVALKKQNKQTSEILLRTIVTLFTLFFLFRAIPMACGGSQDRGPIGAVAAGLRQSHSNSGSKPHLRPTPQLTAMPDP